MKYIKIPIESMAEGKKFAEEIFDAMIYIPYKDVIEFDNIKTPYIISSTEY